MAKENSNLTVDYGRRSREVERILTQTTGALQQVLRELLIDEINHMTKFWGFGCWAYPEASVVQTGWMLLKSSGGRFGYRRDAATCLGRCTA